MSLFAGDSAAESRFERLSSPGNRRMIVNPHLLAARRLARKMRQMPDHSPEETRVGLAICQQLKAFLRDDARKEGREDGREEGCEDGREKWKETPKH